MFKIIAGTHTLSVKLNWHKRGFDEAYSFNMRRDPRVAQFIARAGYIMVGRAQRIACGSDHNARLVAWPTSAHSFCALFGTCAAQIYSVCGSDKSLTFF